MLRCLVVLILAVLVGCSSQQLTLHEKTIITKEKCIKIGMKDDLGGCAVELFRLANHQLSRYGISVLALEEFLNDTYKSRFDKKDCAINILQYNRPAEDIEKDCYPFRNYEVKKKSNGSITILLAWYRGHYGEVVELSYKNGSFKVLNTLWMG